MRRCRSSGFTLVEMMIVVVILGVLAGLAGVGFRRYVARARTAEAVTMLAEVVSREQLYYQEFAHYLPMRSDSVATVATGATGSEASTAFYPVANVAAMGDSARVATALPADVNAWPAQWRALGIRPKDRQLYCTYFANAGFRQSTPGGTYGTYMLGAVQLETPWWYVIGACNLNRDASWPTGVTVLGMSSVSPTLGTWNEGQ